MKTKNNIQKTGFVQVKKSVIGGFAILFCALFIHVTVNARDFNHQFSTNSNCSILTVNMPKMEASQIEEGINFLEYNAQVFVDAEMEHELENGLNNNAETNSAFIEAELALQAAGYNAKDFVEAELTAETENFMNGNNEPYETELAFQVEIYDAKNFADAEMANEIESWMIMQHTTKSIETIASIE